MAGLDNTIAPAISKVHHIQRNRIKQHNLRLSVCRVLAQRERSIMKRLFGLWNDVQMDPTTKSSLTSLDDTVNPTIAFERRPDLMRAEPLMRFIDETPLVRGLSLDSI